MRGLLTVLLLLYTATSLPATGYVIEELSVCEYGDDERGNATFQYGIIFNHVLAIGYDSSEKLFYPSSPIPQMLAVLRKYTKEFNTKPDMMNYVKSEEKRCNENIKTFWNGTVGRRVKPSMEVFSPEQFNEENLPVLICHVWGFYPEDVLVAWIKNENTVVKNETGAVRAGDWTYQVVVKLDLRDSVPEDNYTCIVRHQTLDEPMIKTWKAGLTSIQITKISVSTVIFGLGLIVLLVGVFLWRNGRRSGYSPIPGYNDQN